MYKLFFMFFIGILEAFLLSLNTKFLQRSKKIPCFIVSFINILIWFTVIEIAMESLTNWKLRIVYAFGFSYGDILAISFDNFLEKLSKTKGKKFIKKYFKRWLK